MKRCVSRPLRATHLVGFESKDFSGSNSNHPADSSPLAPFPLGRTLRWRDFVALQLLRLRGTLLPSGAKFAPRRNRSLRTFLLHTKS
jgi:hypothetical protein